MTEERQRQAADADAELVELMTGYQAGDAAAFDALYERLVPGLRGYLISLARDADTASDLLQETFLQMHRSRRTYAPPRPVRAWAFGVARNVFLMRLRAKARRREIQPLDERAFDALLPSTAGRVLDRDLLDRALARLAPEQAETWLLHHAWGFSFPEVARILGCSASAAKVRSHRSMKQLRAFLDRTATVSSPAREETGK